MKADDGSEGEVMEKMKFKEDVEALVKDEDTLSEGLKRKLRLFLKLHCNQNHC